MSRVARAVGRSFAPKYNKFPPACSRRFFHSQVRSFSAAATNAVSVRTTRDTQAYEHLKSTVDLLSYYEESKPTLDGRGLVALLKQLAFVAKGSDATAMLADGRFHSLLEKLTEALEDLEAKYVVTTASALAAFRTSTQELTEITSALSGVVQRRPNAFTPTALSNLTLAFAARRFEDEELVFFMTQECKKVFSEAKCFDVIMLLDGLNRWGIFDREIVDLSVRKFLMFLIISMISNIYSLHIISSIVII